MQIATIHFKINGKPTTWQIANNLDEFGVDIESAFDCWQARTDNYTEASFCEYLVSKDQINFKATPKDIYDLLNK